MLPQLQIANHFRTQHARDIRRCRSAAARRDLFRNAASANNLASLEHQRLQPGTRQVGCCGKPVVPASDDDGFLNDRQSGFSERLDHARIGDGHTHEVFRFFADAENLEALTPAWLNFAIRSPGPITMGKGTLIDYDLRLHGLPGGGHAHEVIARLQSLGCGNRRSRLGRANPRK